MASAPASPAAPNYDLYLRRLVWFLFAVTCIGGLIVYAGKAQDERSAIIRWLYQVRQLQAGENIWDRFLFPNPPIFPLSLYPFTWMPPLAAALTWYAFKVMLTVGSIAMVFRMAKSPDDARAVPWWVQLGVLGLSFRPILSDLHHANNNLVILFLVVSTLYAWRKGYDVLAGLCLSLAICYKVTPGLFLLYFGWRRSWRLLGATALGIVLFLFVVPSMILGPELNGVYLQTWWHRIIRPFVADDVVGFREINQSMAGVLMRIFTENTPGEARYNPQDGLNLFSVEPRYVVWAIKGISVGLVGLLLWLCRTPNRDRTDPRLLGEFSLVVLTMLIVSERSWKHHYVTILLPFAYLGVRLWCFDLKPAARWTVAGLMSLAGLCMLTTSSEVGGLFANGEGHKLAQYYGLFFWTAVVLYGATAWRLRSERNWPSPTIAEPSERSVPGHHLDTAARARVAE